LVLPSTRPVVLAALVVAAAIGASAQEARLRIASPTEATYLAGKVRLLAVIEPASAARDVTRVTFFADGTQVCAVTTSPFECDWDSGERIKAHQIRAVALMRNGQRLVQMVTTKDLEYVENVDVDVVPITAVVTDDHGRFVTGLTQKDFRVTDDGTPQKITSFSDEHSPLELVTAIDVSSSVREALPQIKKASIRFLRGLEPADQVTVLGFNDNIFTLARRSTDQVVRERAVGRLASWGATALYDAIMRAVGMLGSQPGRRAIVLFTDGDDQSSHAPLETVIAQVEGSDAMIYAVGQGRAVNTKDLQKLLQRLATTSGGRAFFSNDTSKLDEIFAEILDDLHHQYLLAYPTPGDQRDGKYHRVTVVANGGKYHVRTRQGYRLTRKP
jgi:Ca-activated chloride channel family protein